MTVRAVLADDHPLFLDGLRLLLESAGITVVGTATTGHELLDLLEQVDADVAVVDLDMPELDGVATTREIERRRPGLPVLVLTMHDADAAVQKALRAGARGYVVKGAAHGTVVRSLIAVAEGDVVLAGGVGRELLGRPLSSGSRPFPALTDRETEVLGLVARGYPNARISTELHLSLKTVQNHVSNIMGKLGATSRAQVVAADRDAGVGSPARPSDA